MRGRVRSVKDEYAGTELAADAAIAATTLSLVDMDELDQPAGTLLIGDEEIAYTVADDTLTLASGLAAAYSAEEPVHQHPLVVERRAHIQAEDQDEEVEARVSHQLHDLLPLGIRESTEEAEVVVAEYEDGDLVVRDVPGKQPEIDIGYLGGMEISSGRADIAAQANPFATSDPVLHGLSDTPTTVLATVDHSINRGVRKIVATVGSLNTTDFVIGLRTSDETNLLANGSAGPIRVYWVAIHSTAISGLIDTDALPTQDVDSSYTIGDDD